MRGASFSWRWFGNTDQKPPTIYRHWPNNSISRTLSQRNTQTSERSGVYVQEIFTAGNVTTVKNVNNQGECLIQGWPDELRSIYAREWREHIKIWYSSIFVDTERCGRHIKELRNRIEYLNTNSVCCKSTCVCVRVHLCATNMIPPPSSLAWVKARAF